MKKEYDEIMEHIEVTSEMRQRILDHISKEDFSQNRPQIIRFPAVKKHLATAACLVLILAGAVALPRLIEPGRQEPDVVTVPSIVEAGSLQELSQQIGFEVTERFDLPFNAEETSYMSYWGELAELHYSGEGQTAVYRQSIGTEDNSGDYDTYKDVTEITVNEMNITLKGNDGIYTLAVWTDGEYSYSLSLSSGVSENSWRSSLSH